MYRTVFPELLKYNRNWDEIDVMLKEMLSPEFRNKYLDNFGNGWKYSWHCMDHMGIYDNPREKDIGYGKIFKHYKEILKEYNCNSDEINWHFHPLSLTRKSTHAATSYLNNYDILNEVAIAAMLMDFVVNSPDGFSTFVGERGVKLSGGQRQRIGIARALYKKAAILIFDEATSALDNGTEKKIMNNISKLDKNITILIVAHRLTTLKNCNFLIKVANKKIIQM